MILDIKHLAPYLPYRLKCIYPDKENQVFILTGLRNPYKTVDKWHLNTELRLDKTTRVRSHVFNLEDPSLNFKPILRPLRDLTKEIKHNREKFIPMEKLFKIEYEGTTHVDGIRNIYTEERGRFLETSHFGTAATTSVNVVSIFQNNYWKIKQLLEWHFDVFGLIDNDLAININFSEA